MSRLTRHVIFVTFESDCICCAERRMIKTLKRECFKRGNRGHQFAAWVKRKFGTLVIQRETSYGEGVSLPCVLCRKVIEKYGIRWKAYDGETWIDSLITKNIPKQLSYHWKARVKKQTFRNSLHLVYRTIVSWGLIAPGRFITSLASFFSLAAVFSGKWPPAAR